MKSKTKAIIFSCIPAVLLFSDVSIVHGEAAAHTQTVGRLQVIAPDNPGDLVEPVKPVYPLAPEQPIISDQLTPSITRESPAIKNAEFFARSNIESIDVNALKESVDKATKDWLGFNFISRNLYFTIQRPNPKSITLYAEPLQVTLSDRSQSEFWPHYVQLSDERGRYTGWTLSVKQEAQFIRTNDSAEIQTLAGAQLSLGTDFGAAELLETSANASFKPTKVSTKTTLIPEVAADLVVAQKDQGLGTWIYRFGNEKTLEKSISLTIPAKQYKNGQYISILTWSLLDAPVA